MCSLLLVLRVSLLAVLMPLCWSPGRAGKLKNWHVVLHICTRDFIIFVHVGIIVGARKEDCKHFMETCTESQILIKKCLSIQARRELQAQRLFVYTALSEGY